MAWHPIFDIQKLFRKIITELAAHEVKLCTGGVRSISTQITLNYTSTVLVKIDQRPVVYPEQDIQFSIKTIINCCLKLLICYHFDPSFHQIHVQITQIPRTPPMQSSKIRFLPYPWFPSHDYSTAEDVGLGAYILN